MALKKCLKCLKCLNFAVLVGEAMGKEGSSMGTVEIWDFSGQQFTFDAKTGLTR